MVYIANKVELQILNQPEANYWKIGCVTRVKYFSTQKTSIYGLCPIKQNECWKHEGNSISPHCPDFKWLLYF